VKEKRKTTVGGAARFRRLPASFGLDLADAGIAASRAGF
jgi:hypothetical protein